MPEQIGNEQIIHPLYKIAYQLSEVEVLAKIEAFAERHAILERILDGALFELESAPRSYWKVQRNFERIFCVGGRLRILPESTLRRLRKRPKGCDRGEARR